jgi:hypothetical protein
MILGIRMTTLYWADRDVRKPETHSSLFETVTLHYFLSRNISMLLHFRRSHKNAFVWEQNSLSVPALFSSCSIHVCVLFCLVLWTLCIHWTSGDVHTNEAHKNNDNNTAPMFIGLNKTIQNHRRRKRKMTWERIKGSVLKQMYFSVNDENARALKYFGLRTSAVWRFRKVNSCLRMAK